MLICSVWDQVNYEDMCLSHAMPEVIVNRSDLRYASRELLDVFKLNHNKGGQVEWQTFGMASGIGYYYPAIWYDERVFTSIEVRFR